MHEQVVVAEIATGEEAEHRAACEHEVILVLLQEAPDGRIERVLEADDALDRNVRFIFVGIDRQVGAVGDVGQIVVVKDGFGELDDGSRRLRSYHVAVEVPGSQRMCEERGRQSGYAFVTELIRDLERCCSSCSSCSGAQSRRRRRGTRARCTASESSLCCTKTPRRTDQSRSSVLSRAAANEREATEARTFDRDGVEQRIRDLDEGLERHRSHEALERGRWPGRSDPGRPSKSSKRPRTPGCIIHRR